MIQFPNAKINLGLNIVERRPDGYHNIETALFPIPLNDILEIVPAKGGDTTLTTYGRPVGCPPEKNLVMKACRLMQRELGAPPVDIYLNKIIPDGAGLGGGSADAAFTMTMLNQMFGLNAGNDKLAKLAASIGADCPFFILNQPALATGIGDILTPLTLSLKGYRLVLVKNDSISVPTKAAYSQVTPSHSHSPIAQILAKPVETWQESLKNDFEPSVFKQFPQLAATKQELLDQGAAYAAMSGSGSSVFGLFNSAIMADQRRLSHFGNIFEMQL